MPCSGFTRATGLFMRKASSAREPFARLRPRLPSAVPPTSKTPRCRSRFGSPTSPAFPPCPTATRLPAPGAWRSSSTCPAGSTPTSWPNRMTGSRPARPKNSWISFDALAASGPGSPSPETDSELPGQPSPGPKRFAEAPKPAPASFATESYYGVNAFRFINREGTSRHGPLPDPPGSGRRTPGLR